MAARVVVVVAAVATVSVVMAAVVMVAMVVAVSLIRGGINPPNLHAVRGPSKLVDSRAVVRGAWFPVGNNSVRCRGIFRRDTGTAPTRSTHAP